MGRDLARVDASRLLAPLGSPLLAGSTAVRAFGWDVEDSHGGIVDLTTWTSVEALGALVAEERVRHLRRSGPIPEAPTVRAPLPAPAAPDRVADPDGDWLCPA